MRILHAIEATGGVMSVVNQYVEWQVDQGNDVHLLLPEGVHSKYGTQHTWNPNRRTPRRWPAAVKALRQVIDEIQPDVLHLHSFFPGLFGRSFALRGPSRPAIIYQPHSWAFDRSPTPVGPFMVGAWERWASRRTDAFIVNCMDEAEEGRRHGIDLNTYPVGVPLDLERFSPADAEERRQLRNKMGFDERKVLLSVGRLTRQKGQDQLIDAWRRRPIPGAVLVLIGPGDPTPLKELAGPEWGHSVVYRGATDEVRDWLCASDVLVTASRWEGQAVAVAEALACGVPVISTDVNGAREAISDGPEGPAGTVVERGDMAALMTACRRRVQDPGILVQEALSARPRALRMFSRDDVAQRVDNVYRSLVGSTAQPGSRETA